MIALGVPTNYINPVETKLYDFVSTTNTIMSFGYIIWHSVRARFS